MPPAVPKLQVTHDFALASAFTRALTCHVLVHSKILRVHVAIQATLRLKSHQSVVRCTAFESILYEGCTEKMEGLAEAASLLESLHHQVEEKQRLQVRTWRLVTDQRQLSRKRRENFEWWI